ncbi:MAG: ornithine carbamoyltransferase [Candidatus Azotimanducaceae bacterium]|jgi:ornithine carbamoyltransferase
MRHVPNLQSFSPEELSEILRLSAEIKASPADYHHALSHLTMAMLFQKTSTRTRVSFEAGMTELGGHAIYVDWMTSNFLLSGIDHETAYLSRNVSFIMARLLHHEDLQTIMGASEVPVINGCDEMFHPCQALTDVLTMQENFEGDIADAHIVYVGVQNNVSNSLVTLCHKLGIQLTLATPTPDDNGESQNAYVQDIISGASPAQNKVQHTEDAKAAVQGADFVYTDTWIDMQYFNNPAHKDENAAKLKKMMPYQLNHELLKDVDCKVMHDMPIHDGFEISAELARDDRAIIYPQAANRMHAQKGLLCWLNKQR